MKSKSLWFAAENFAADFLSEKWRKILTKNFTIRGGELDLVATRDSTLLIAEIKLVQPDTELLDFLPPKKLAALRRTTEEFLAQHPELADHEIQPELIFVQKIQEKNWEKNWKKIWENSPTKNLEKTQQKTLKKNEKNSSKNFDEKIPTQKFQILDRLPLEF